MDRNKVLGANWVEINLDNLEYNYRGLRKKVRKDAKMCMVIKANGYGHGALELAKFYDSLGADFYAVARAYEGIELRCGGIKTPILNLGVTADSELEDSVKQDISMTTFSIEFAKKANDIARIYGKKARLHIKLDTGMSRLGFVVKEEKIGDIVKEIEEIQKLENVVIEGIFTHFASADIANKEFEKLQFSRFKKVVDALEKVGIVPEFRHCSNSAEILDTDEMYDMVRPGIIQYGIYPSDEVNKSVDVKPVMSFKTRVTNVKILEPGVSIGYGRTYFTTVDEKIASIAVGYADGFLRGRKNPYVYIKGVKCPVVGRVCMDQCMVRVPEELDVSVGDEVLLFGEELVTCTDVANECSTIEHEVLCNINRRVPRVYTKGGEIVKIVNYLK